MTDKSKDEGSPVTAAAPEVNGYDVEMQPISPDATPRLATGAEPVRGHSESAKDEPIMADKARVELLLMSGKRKGFDFKEETTVAEVKAWIYKNWPSDWSEEAPSSVAALRLLYLGKFLDDSATLAESKIRHGVSTIVHLVIRQTPPAPKSRFALGSSKRDGADSAPSGGLCSSCLIQ